MTSYISLFESNPGVSYKAIGYLLWIYFTIFLVTVLPCFSLQRFSPRIIFIRVLLPTPGLPVTKMLNVPKDCLSSC